MVCVQRLLIMLVLFVVSFCTNSVYAETILTDENFIPYVAGKESRNKVVVEKYKFTLTESSRVKLHFISKVRNDVSFKLIETDTENIIGAFSKELSFEDSPFTQEVDLSAGKYTFIVYKEPSYGSVHNTGKYRFSVDKVEWAQSISEQVAVKRYENYDVRNGNTKKITKQIDDKDNNKGNYKELLDEKLKIIGGLAAVFTILAGTRLNFIAKLIIALITIWFIARDCI